MSARIAVDFDVLRSHATRVDGIAAQVGTARDAAQSIDLGGGAFGLMCAFLVLPASIVSNAATNLIGNAEDMVRRSAEQVRAVAADFSALEEQFSAEVGAIGATLE